MSISYARNRLRKLIGASDEKEVADLQSRIFTVDIPEDEKNKVRVWEYTKSGIYLFTWQGKYPEGYGLQLMTKSGTGTEVTEKIVAVERCPIMVIDYYSSFGKHTWYASIPTSNKKIIVKYDENTDTWTSTYAMYPNVTADEIYLESPNGTGYKLSVADDGTLSTVSWS